MWIFTDSGFLSLLQHPNEPEMLIVQARSRGEMDRLVEVLDEIAGHKHELEPAVEQGCRFATVAQREDVGRPLSQMAAEINYSNFVQSVQFDFGDDPRFILRVGDGDLQLARIKPFVR